MLRSRIARGICPAPSASECRRLAGLGAAVVLLHLAGWGALVFVVGPRYPGLVGVGFVAYLLGVRHAFDADHISAIDNTTRKLLQQGGKPVGVGFFFSLGHSAVVLLLAMALSLATRPVSAQVMDDGSLLRGFGGLVGALISSSFLYLIAALNLSVLIHLLRIFIAMRRHDYDDGLLEAKLQPRGFLNRYLGRFSQMVSSSWHMAPVGFLFGFGFETASEIALLTLAAGAVSSGLPLDAVVSLPLIFAAGMTLMDTADGVLMSQAYGWALTNPIQKIYYNLIVTGLSVAAALLVGSIELLGTFQRHMGLSGWFWRAIADLELGSIGYAIVGLFVLTWLASLGLWKLGRIE